MAISGVMIGVGKVPEEVETLTLDQVEVKSHVGGLVKSYERKAA